MKYKSEGVKEAYYKIETFVKESRRSDKIFIAYKALKGLDTTITTLMNDEDYDTCHLLTYRRKTRMLLRKIMN